MRGCLSKVVQPAALTVHQYRPRIASLSVLAYPMVLTGVYDATMQISTIHQSHLSVADFGATVSPDYQSLWTDVELPDN